MALNSVPVLLTVTCFIAIANANANASREKPMQPGFNLTARLETGAGLVECWNALIDLKSCSNELVIFFVNGESEIGPACCQAITMITHHCWPDMMTSLGFTAQEGGILRGYCDASSAAAAAAAAPAPSLQPPLAANSVVMA